MFLFTKKNQLKRLIHLENGWTILFRQYVFWIVKKNQQKEEFNKNQQKEEFNKE